jgi:hypothetical protein
MSLNRTQEKWMTFIKANGNQDFVRRSWGDPSYQVESIQLFAFMVFTPDPAQGFFIHAQVGSNIF